MQAILMVCCDFTLNCEAQLPGNLRLPQVGSYRAPVVLGRRQFNVVEHRDDAKDSIYDHPIAVSTL